MVLAFSRLLLTTDDRIRSQASSCEICCAQHGTGAGNSVFPVRIFPPVRDTHLHLYVALTEGNMTKPDIFP
jgi:hypothetical protein